MERELEEVQTVSEYLGAYAAVCGASPGCDGSNPLHGYAYDGIFTLAVALDAVIRFAHSQIGSPCSKRSREWGGPPGPFLPRG